MGQAALAAGGRPRSLRAAAFVLFFPFALSAAISRAFCATAFFVMPREHLRLLGREAIHVAPGADLGVLYGVALDILPFERTPPYPTLPVPGAVDGRCGC